MTRQMAAPRSRSGVWWHGARPRTLGAAVVPVAVGTAAVGTASPLRTAALLGVALGLQVGVNYANDYFDGVSGVDTPQRAGPVRLTASGLASPRAVAFAAALSLTVAAGLGVWLAVQTSLWLLAVGALALLAAVGYSGGPKPYASLGLGELSVFVFFGPVAVCGSAYVQVGHIPPQAWWSAVPVGLLVVAILVANNLRDIPTDAASGKRTLAVRIGDAKTRTLYRALIASAFVAVLTGVALGSLPVGALGGLPVGALAFLVGVAFALGPWRTAGHAQGAALVPVLLGTARLHLVSGLALAVGVWLT